MIIRHFYIATISLSANLPVNITALHACQCRPIEQLHVRLVDSLSIHFWLQVYVEKPLIFIQPYMNLM
jgi:hypothetical protein